VKALAGIINVMPAYKIEDLMNMPLVMLDEIIESLTEGSQAVHMTPAPGQTGM
jgi:hypothetical protein